MTADVVSMNNIEYVLAHLKLKVIRHSDWKSKFADSILDFWMLPDDCRFITHAYVFRDEPGLAELVEKMAKRPPSTDDAGGKQ
jgi:hypothetical protein